MHSVRTFANYNTCTNFTKKTKEKKKESHSQIETHGFKNKYVYIRGRKANKPGEEEHATWSFLVGDFLRGEERVPLGQLEFNPK